MAKQQELYDALFAAIPETGEIPYQDLHANMVAAGQKEALHYLNQLKRDKKIVTSLTVDPDGTVRNTVRRAP